MISVAQALENLLRLATPTSSQNVPLSDAAGRVLAENVVAARAQPPFAASAMDGYAVPDLDAKPGDSYDVIGEAAAGHRFDGKITAGQAVRIFTGAPVPTGANRIVIQEDVERVGNTITLKPRLDAGTHIRPAGGDFKVGDMITAPSRLGPADLALMASMNTAMAHVRCKPQIALIATGDELVMPGEVPRDDQIIASNCFGLKAICENAGAQVRLLPIAKDTPSSLSTVLELAKGSDLIITIGGASVGDHDIVAQVAGDMGLERSFYKVAMRPGKPLMAGRLGNAMLVGLPGNPVSSMVCGEIFIRPLIDAMLGLPAGPRTRAQAVLSKPLSPNGPREHYMRARCDGDQVADFDRQDSSLLTVLAQANALIVRPPHDPARKIGEMVEIIRL